MHLTGLVMKHLCEWLGGAKFPYDFWLINIHSKSSASNSWKYHKNKVWMEFWSKSPVQLENLAIVNYFYTVLCAKRMVQNGAMCTLLNFFFITNLMPFSVNREGSNLRTFPSKNDLQISGSTSGSSPINYRKKGKIMHPCHSRQLRSWAEHLQMFTLIKDSTEIQLHCKSIISIIATWMLHFTCVYY